MPRDLRFGSWPADDADPPVRSTWAPRGPMEDPTADAVMEADVRPAIAPTASRRRRAVPVDTTALVARAMVRVRGGGRHA